MSKNTNSDIRNLFSHTPSVYKNDLNSLSHLDEKNEMFGGKRKSKHLKKRSSKRKSHDNYDEQEGGRKKRSKKGSKCKRNSSSSFSNELQDGGRKRRSKKGSKKMKRTEQLDEEVVEMEGGKRRSKKNSKKNVKKLSRTMSSKNPIMMVNDIAKKLFRECGEETNEKNAKGEKKWKLEGIKDGIIFRSKVLRNILLKNDNDVDKASKEAIDLFKSGELVKMFKKLVKD